MMIMPRDTGPAETAMLAACWFGEVTGATEVPGMEKNTVIRIAFHLFPVIIWRDERFGHHTFVEENVGRDDDPRNPKLVSTRHPRPCRREKGALADCEQGHKEDLAGTLEEPWLQWRLSQVLTKTNGWFSCRT